MPLLFDLIARSPALMRWVFSARSVTRRLRSCGWMEARFSSGGWAASRLAEIVENYVNKPCNQA